MKVRLRSNDSTHSLLRFFVRFQSELKVCLVVSLCVSENKKMRLKPRTKARNRVASISNCYIIWPCLNCSGYQYLLKLHVESLFQILNVLDNLRKSYNAIENFAIFLHQIRKHIARLIPHATIEEWKEKHHRKMTVSVLKISQNAYPLCLYA